MLYLPSRDHSNVRALTTASHRRPRHRRPAFENLEDKLLLSSYYVALGGSNAANGSAQHPWATIQHAADVVAPGDTVHVAPGTYNGAITSNASGTSTARIVFVSDTPWGAKIRTTGVDTSWSNGGGYVTIQGFDVSGDGREGIEDDGSYGMIIGNYVHDIPATNAGSNGGAGINTGTYTSQGTVITGNMVLRIGDYTNPNAARTVQGIYISNANVVVTNNIVGNIQAFGIHCWHAANAGTIANNLVFRCEASGILVGDGDSPGGVVADNFLVSNNISIYNQDWGIVEEGRTGTHNRYLDNCVYGNSIGAIDLDNGLTASGTVAADPKFVNYRADGSGDYHLAAGSPCIGTGTSQGAPTTDFDGNPRPSPDGLYDIGPYEYTPTPTPTVTLFPSTATPANFAAGDPHPVELGVRFTADKPGYITGVRFYKAATNTGTHTAHLWSASGQFLASATFTAESAAGWQQVNFARPVPIQANTTYVASYHTDTGNYGYNHGYFAGADIANGPLHAPGNGANGVYTYGPSAFPTRTYEASNYWVDVVYAQ